MSSGLGANLLVCEQCFSFQRPLAPRGFSGADLYSSAGPEVVTESKPRSPAFKWLIGALVLLLPVAGAVIIFLIQKPDQDAPDSKWQPARLQFRPVLAEDRPTAMGDDVADGVLGDLLKDSGVDVGQQVLAEFKRLDCAEVGLAAGANSAESGESALETDGLETEGFEPDAPLAVCGPEGHSKYILGPTEVASNAVASASAAPLASGAEAESSEWVVTIEFDSQGEEAFAELSGRVSTLDSPQDQVAIVVDDHVVSTMRIMQEIAGGSAQISGNFTRESAEELANKLGGSDLSQSSEN